MKIIEYPHFTQKAIERIVDGKNIDFVDVTDEFIVDKTEKYVETHKIVFWKPFGRKIRLMWRTYFGTPETVKTIFYVPYMES